MHPDDKPVLLISGARFRKGGSASLIMLERQPAGSLDDSGLGSSTPGSELPALSVTLHWNQRCIFIRGNFTSPTNVMDSVPTSMIIGVRRPINQVHVHRI